MEALLPWPAEQEHPINIDTQQSQGQGRAGDQNTHEKNTTEGARIHWNPGKSAMLLSAFESLTHKCAWNILIYSQNLQKCPPAQLTL